MSRFISLLRGINVSGQKKIKMADLKNLYESLGFENVLTYIQSGNVIFDSKENPENIVEKIELAIQEKYTFKVPVQIRNVSVFENIIQSCPFPKLDLIEEGTRVMVTFLDREPEEPNIALLMDYVKAPERLLVQGREVYLHCPNGYGKTKLSNNFIENKLKVKATTRNWKSVLKLFELANNN